MEVPDQVKENLRQTLLLQIGGVFIDEVCQLYRRLNNQNLPFRELGYHNMEALLRSMPEIARLEYSVRDEKLRVHGVTNFMFTLDLPTDEWKSPLRLPDKSQERQVKVARSNVLKNEAGAQGSGSAQEVQPDYRGFYNLCFPAMKKPMNLMGTLEDMFSVAGKVAEVYETVRWIYVCYTDLPSVERAFKMFSHMELKAATDSAFKVRANGEKRKFEGMNQHSAPYSTQPRKRKKAVNSPCHRVFIGNLNPTIRYTFDMFRKLLHKYRITWITVKSAETEGPNPKTSAYILAANRQDADAIVKDFDGFIWYGRPLHLHVKEKQANKQQGETNSMDISRDASSAAEEEGPGRSTPRLRGKRQDMPGLEPAMPGLESAMPGLEPAMPGLEPAMPGLEPAMPGLEPGMPGLEPAMPGLEPILPPLEPALPPLEPALPPLEPALPPLEPALPPLEPALPGLERVGSLENLHVQRSFEAPTVLVTNFREDVEEAALASLFAVYCPKAIRIFTSPMGRKKAFIELGSVEDVRQAVSNLNQSLFNGLRMKVDVPFNLPHLRKAVLGHDHLQAAASGTVTLSEVLKLRGHILGMMQLQDFPFHLGQQVQVLITTVISDKFFWGQVSDVRMAQELQKISNSLNEPCKTEVVTGPGRCKARFQGDGKWYRAWVMRNSDPAMGQQCRVFYLDYGNTAQIPWTHTAKAPERWHWAQPPLAIPFTLIEGVPNLKDRELTNIMVEVNALGKVVEGNMVVVRATSLVPSLNESVSTITRTIVM